MICNALGSFALGHMPDRAAAALDTALIRICLLRMILIAMLYRQWRMRWACSPSMSCSQPSDCAGRLRHLRDRDASTSRRSGRQLKFEGAVVRITGGQGKGVARSRG